MKIVPSASGRRREWPFPCTCAHFRGYQRHFAGNFGNELRQAAPAFLTGAHATDTTLTVISDRSVGSCVNAFSAIFPTWPWTTLEHIWLLKSSGYRQAQYCPFSSFF